MSTNWGFAIARYLAWFLIALLAIIVFATVALKIYKGSELDHVSGAWAVLANDLANGVFYRPLYCEKIGFGGTRFFPLYFFLHTIFIYWTQNIILAGQLLSMTIGIGYLLISYLLMKNNNSNIILVLLCILAASKTVMHGCTAIRGDLLALLWNLLGIYVISQRGCAGNLALILCALCFTIAFSTKVTALNGLVTVVVWKFFTREGREAIKILLATGMGISLVCLLLYFTTEGRIFSIFYHCGSGGADIITAIKAPVRFVTILATRDVVSLVIVMWVFMTVDYLPIPKERGLFSIFFGVSFVQTLIIFVSPGIAYNHLVDMTTAAILLLSCNLRPPQAFPRLVPVFLFVLLWSVFVLNGEYKRNDHQYSSELVQYIAKMDNVLCEDPLVAILSRQQLYLQDAFMYKFIIRKYPIAEQVLLQKIDDKQFDAVVLKKDHEKELLWYKNVHFNKKFIDILSCNYKFEREISKQRIFKPY